MTSGIRQAVPSDSLVVRDLVMAAYQPYVARIGKPPGPMLDDYDARIALGQTWVLEVDGRIAAILVLEEKDDIFLLDNIAVAPGSQGLGHGRTLMQFAEGEARRRGYPAIHLYTHVLMTENIGLYQRIGFKELRRVREHGFDRVYMAKPLL